MKKIFFSFIVWRFLLFVSLLIGYFFIPYRLDSPYTNILYFIKPYFPVDHFFLFPWANFDGVHYLSIAGDGYNQNARFFPLFPLLIFLFSRLFGDMQTFGGTQFFIALTLANLFFLASLFIFYKLVRLDFSKKVAIFSLLFLLTFPTSFFFVSIYSESLFLLLTISSFYFARKRKWFLAGVFGMLLSATRVVGVFIFAALLYEFFRVEKGNLRKLIVKTLSLFLVPFGLIFYSIFNLFKWGDALYFLHNQGEVANERSVTSLVFPLQTLFRYSKILGTVSKTTYEWWVALLELFVFGLGVFLLYTAFRKKINFSYLLFSVLAFLTPVLSGTLSGLPRYIIVLFPIYISLALIEGRIIKIIILGFFSIILFLLLMLFSRGYFIA